MILSQPHETHRDVPEPARDHSGIKTARIGRIKIQADSGLRSRAADELGHIGAAAASAVPELMKALDDESQQVRSSSSLALGNIGPASRRAIPKLIRTLKDKSLDVRYSASLALSRIGTPEARKALKRYIREEAYRRIEQE